MTTSATSAEPRPRRTEQPSDAKVFASTRFPEKASHSRDPRSKDCIPDSSDLRSCIGPFVHNTNTIQTTRPTFHGGAGVSNLIQKDNANLLLELSIANTGGVDGIVRFHEAYSNIIAFLLNQKKLHAALSADTFDARDTTMASDKLFVQEYTFKCKGSGIQTILATDLTAPEPTLTISVEPADPADVAARHLAGAIKEHLVHFAA